MISSKRSSQARSQKRTSPRRQSSGWEITIILNEEFRAESINADETGVRGLEPQKWLGSWVDDIFCSEEGDTFVSSSIVSNLDLQSFDLNVCVKSHPEYKTCARIKKLHNGRTHSFLLNCFFWNDNTHHPFTRRDAFEQLGDDSELCFCDFDFDKSQFKVSPSLWLMLGYSLTDVKLDFEAFRKLVHPEDLVFF